MKRLVVCCALGLVCLAVLGGCKGQSTGPATSVPLPTDTKPGTKGIPMG
jgi:hypothetical protein